MNRYGTRRTFGIRHVLVALTALLFGVGQSAVFAQTVVSEFPVQNGSSVRAGLLYAAMAPSAEEAASGPTEDPWIAFDKVEHATFGFLFTLGGQYVFVNKGGLNENESLPLAIGVAASAAIAKELYDRRYGSGHFSHRDLVADATGIAVAVVLILL